jgi:hypothetical protein
MEQKRRLLMYIVTHTLIVNDSHKTIIMQSNPSSDSSFLKWRRESRLHLALVVVVVAVVVLTTNCSVVDREPVHFKPPENDTNFKH